MAYPIRPLKEFLNPTTPTYCDLSRTDRFAGKLSWSSSIAPLGSEHELIHFRSKTRTATKLRRGSSHSRSFATANRQAT
jgi:hypothetical protein